MIFIKKGENRIRARVLYCLVQNLFETNTQRHHLPLVCPRGGREGAREEWRWGKLGYATVHHRRFSPKIGWACFPLSLFFLIEIYLFYEGCSGVVVDFSSIYGALQNFKFWSFLSKGTRWELLAIRIKRYKKEGTKVLLLCLVLHVVSGECRAQV